MPTEKKSYISRKLALVDAQNWVLVLSALFRHRIRPSARHRCGLICSPKTRAGAGRRPRRSPNEACYSKPTVGVASKSIILAGQRRRPGRFLRIEVLFDLTPPEDGPPGGRDRLRSKRSDENKRGAGLDMPRQSAFAFGQSSRFAQDVDRGQAQGPAPFCAGASLLWTWIGRACASIRVRKRSVSDVGRGSRSLSSPIHRRRSLPRSEAEKRVGNRAAFEGRRRWLTIASPRNAQSRA